MISAKTKLCYGNIPNNKRHEVKVNIEISSPVLEGNGDINQGKCERIKACIDSFLEANPRLSLQNVEDKTGVPISTLRRITYLKGNPQPETVIKVFLALGFDNELVLYMKDFHPEIATVMALKNSHNQEYEYVTNEDRQYFLEESNFLILSLAYTTSGTTEDEVRFELGERGVSKLQELLAKGIVLRMESGQIVGKIKDFKLPFSDVKKRVEFALKHYRLEEAGGVNNWMSYQTESLNDEGLKVLKNLEQKQFNDRKDLVFNKAMYLGNKKVYSLAVSSTFLAYKDSGVLE